VQFRSLHSLARRTLAAGATSALALTLFNAVQPSLDTPHRIGPGTIKDVAVTLVPTAAASPGAAAPRGRLGRGRLDQGRLDQGRVAWGRLGRSCGQRRVLFRWVRYAPPPGA
jgi:hypothetical protein